MYGHLGHWRCPKCGNTLAEPDVLCLQFQALVRGCRFTLKLAHVLVEVSVWCLRACVMALRLKYAGIDGQGASPNVEPEPARALRRALRATSEGSTLYVIPTYTAMFVFRQKTAYEI